MDMDKLDKLTEVILNIKKDTEDINRELKNLKEEWRNKQEKWEKEKEEMESRIKKLENNKEQTEDMLERLKELEKREDEREKRERRNNIIVSGEEMLHGDTPKDTIQKILSQNLQVEAEIEEAFWIRRGKTGSAVVAKLRN